MRRAFNRLTGPKKLVRRVLSKSSDTSQVSNEQNSSVSMTKNTSDSIQQEIVALQQQIDNLKAAVNVLQEDLDKKNLVIAKLAREKEKISLDLLKQKRSNSTIAQQLEDERNFYYKEKEMYCQEMNEMKKLKKNMSSVSVNVDEKTLNEYKATIEKLKESLNQTLQANYNLSIKFLRMKNTKTCLKNELKRMQLDHEKIVTDLRTKIEKLTSNVNELAEGKLCFPISPSSRKYLQVMKHNSCLVYENLCLQLEVDRLNLKLEKQRLSQVKAETNSKLKYLKPASEVKECASEDNKSNHRCLKKSLKEPKHVRISDLPTTDKCKQHSSKDMKVVKIFERTEKPGIPQIQILKEVDSSKKTYSCETRPERDTKLAKVVEGMTLNRDDEKLALQQMSDVQSQLSSDLNECTSGFTSESAVRVQSAPEIVQSCLFDNCKK